MRRTRKNEIRNTMVAQKLKKEEICQSMEEIDQSRLYQSPKYKWKITRGKLM